MKLAIFHKTKEHIHIYHIQIYINFGNYTESFPCRNPMPPAKFFGLPIIYITRRKLYQNKNDLVCFIFPISIGVLLG